MTISVDQTARETPSPTPAPATPRRRRQGHDDLPAGLHPSKLSRFLVYGGLVLFLFYSVAPVWFLVVSATKSQRDLYTTGGLWFADFHLFDNVGRLFTYDDGIFLRWLANTLFYGIAGTVGMTVVCVACGYGLAMYQFRGRGFMMGCIIASFLVPGALLTIPSFLLFTTMRIVDTPWAIIVPHFFSAFSVYLAKVYAEGAIPPELIEAARMDGASEYRIFIQIGSRLMSTGAATIFLLGFVGSWNSFYGPLVFLRGERKWTVMLGLYSWLNVKLDQSIDLTSLVIVGSIVSLIPMVLLMLSMQRYWRAGITLGSLK